MTDDTRRRLAAVHDRTSQVAGWCDAASAEILCANGTPDPHTIDVLDAMAALGQLAWTLKVLTVFDAVAVDTGGRDDDG